MEKYSYLENVFEEVVCLGEGTGGGGGVTDYFTLFYLYFNGHLEWIRVLFSCIVRAAGRSELGGGSAQFLRTRDSFGV